MLQPALGIMLVLGASMASGDVLNSSPKETAIHVECHGKIRHGVVAIGGETTGITITFDEMTWELKFPDEASRQAAKKHHKESITVVGSLRKVRGTTIPVRWIVDVDRMTPRNAATEPERTHVKVIGVLRKQDAAAGSPQILMIEAADISWPLDLSAKMSTQTKAESLVGKPVVLVGWLERGSEAKPPLQLILRVEKLDASTGTIAPK